MLRLTRLNRAPIVINCDVVAYVESDPDTLVTLLNGEKLHVRESVDELIEQATLYQRGFPRPKET